jgi:glycosyltransferase involved in cell wall biosynthesis
MIVGGAQENTLLTIIDHIEKGHKVFLVTGESSGPEGELLKNKKFSNLKIISCPELVRNLSPLKDLQAYFSLKKILKDLTPDVVHTHSSKAGIIGRAAAYKVKVPFICHTVHGQAFHRYEKKWKNFIYKTAERWAAVRCHKIFAVADAMIQQCIDARIAAPEKYKTVYSGMELERYLNPDISEITALREKLQIPKNANVIITVARLFPLKGYEYLLPAAEIISKSLDNVYFLVVGNGIMYDEIKVKTEKAGLKFVFSGLVPPADVYKYIAVSDLMLHLSLREGLPRTVVQSLASGKPAIAFDLDGSPEVIIHGKSGYIAEPENYRQVANFALKLLKSPDDLKTMGKYGRKLVKNKFDWRRMGDILEEEYRKGLEEQEAGRKNNE